MDRESDSMMDETHFELLSRDELLQLVADDLALVMRPIAMHDGGQWRRVLSVDPDVQPHEFIRSKPDLLEGHRCISWTSIAWGGVG